ncbi:MAG TPA: hypothetical protein VMW17_21630 [Candidatus Binatia bacterium]|nr:hypothetical protein [Candidatus Binatia bacterium]
MLTHVDRVQLVVANRREVAGAYQRLLATEVVRDDRVRSLAAHRTVLRLGRSELELLEPDGAGITADFLSQTGGGMFAAGLATADVAALKAHLQTSGATVSDEGGQLFLAPDDTGLRAVISANAHPSAIGLVTRLYEATLLVPDFRAASSQTAARFALDPSHFVPIRSEQFGYEGTLTLFRSGQLDRIEIVTPNDPTKTMARFFAKRGPCLYMCFAEADDLAPIIARLREHAARDWTGAPDETNSLFIHPKALGGMMMGVSRTTVAWTWSGHPEWVQTRAAT